MTRPPFTAALVLTAIAAIAALRRPSHDPLSQYWIAAPPHGDYVETMGFAEDGSAHLVWGYGQLVRCEVDGRWSRERRDHVRLEYIDDEGEFEERRVHFTLDRGAFEFVDHDTDETRHFACRLTLDESLFPRHCETQRVYYGCER